MPDKHDCVRVYYTVCDCYEDILKSSEELLSSQLAICFESREAANSDPKKPIECVWFAPRSQSACLSHAPTSLHFSELSPPKTEITITIHHPPKQPAWPHTQRTTFTLPPQAQHAPSPFRLKQAVRAGRGSAPSLPGTKDGARPPAVPLRHRFTQQIWRYDMTPPFSPLFAFNTASP